MNIMAYFFLGFGCGALLVTIVNELTRPRITKQLLDQAEEYLNYRMNRDKQNE